MLFKTSIDLSGNELQNPRMHNLSGNPSSPSSGIFYFDTTDKCMKYYNGTSWAILSGQYAFNSGTVNGTISVTPFGGTASNVSVFGLSNAAYKGVDNTISDIGSTNLPTTAAITSYISNQLTAADVMRFKGTLGVAGTVTDLPTTSNTGDTYKVKTVGTYAGQSAQLGDLFIALMDSPTLDTSGWALIPSGGSDGSVVGTSLTSDSVVIGNGGSSVKALANGTNGQVLKMVGGTPTWGTDTDTTYTSGTGIKITAGVVGHSNVITAGTASEGGASRTLSFGGTFNIPSITYDAQGHINAKSSITITMPPSPLPSNNALKYTSTNPSLTPSSGICTWSVTHSLGVQYPTVQIYDTATKSMVMAEVSATSANVSTISISSSTTISAGAYQVVITG